MAPKLTPAATQLTTEQPEIKTSISKPVIKSNKVKLPPKTPSRTGSASLEKKDRLSVTARKTPRLVRKGLSEEYEKPVSGREGWWRKDIRETPVPGAYDSLTFLSDLGERPATYQFKNEGRKKDPDPARKGGMLLPGAYESQDVTYHLDKTRYTYSFKNTSRSKDLPTVKDKDINVCPTSYAMESYLTLTVEKTPSKHMVFKSQFQRFPTVYFQGTKNPPPCHYQYKPPKALHSISSSFKSKTPRFASSHTRVPGPGTYDATYQSPMPATIARMGRNHGLFFTSAFQA